MRKALLSLLAAFTLCVAALAVPATPRLFKVKQADGTIVTYRLTGDETSHMLTTLDGIPLLRMADGSLCYAEVSGSELRPTTRLAHDPAARTAEEIAHLATLRIDRAARAELVQARRAARVKAPASSPARAGGNFGGKHYSGQKKGIIILVNFQDVKMQPAHTKAVYENMANLPGYSEGGNTGSVRDYFYEQSYGQLEVTFDVFGPVTVSKNMAYYGANDMRGQDLRPEYMVREACQLIDDECDFSKYDWDGDGEVDQVFVIYAGYGEANGTADENTIWQHKHSFRNAGMSTMAADGVRIDTYACSCELNYKEGVALTLDGIGTICHEYSHCFGLADAYDIDYSGGKGMGPWSVMDNGCRNGSNYQPCGYSAFERWSCGWLEPVELSKGRRVNEMKSIDSAPEAYVIYNEGKRDEFYLLENRQQRGFNVSDYGHGLLVTRIDYNAAVWEDNAPNDNPSLQRYSFVPADNKYATAYGSYWIVTADDGKGDPYPGTTGNTSLTDTSTPKAELNNFNSNGYKLLGKPIENIRESSGGLISFDFNGGVPIAVPVATDATNLASCAFTANWNAVADATGYDLHVAEYAPTPAEKLAIKEDFEVSLANQRTESTADYSKFLDVYLSTKGWTGEKLYTAPSRLRLGNPMGGGTLVSPLQALPESGRVTVFVDQANHSDGGTTLTVSLTDEAGATLATKDIEVDGGKYVASFDGIATAYKVSIASAKRTYLKCVGIYAEAFTLGDIEDGVPAGEETVYENVQGTSHALTGLAGGKDYSYRVRALCAEGATEWSNAVIVKIGHLSTGIDNVIAAPAARKGIYTLDGRKVESITRPGIYIVDGKKVIK